MKNQLNNYYEYIDTNQDKKEHPGGLIMMSLAEIKPLLTAS